MPTDRLRETWARGGTALNAWLTLEGAASAAAVAAAGFDSVTLDLQHGAAEPHDAARIFAAIEAAGAAPLARVRWNDPAELMRMLDVGARGIVCPMIGSRAEAEAFVAACRYPPEGIRSYGPVHGALGAGREHVSRANQIVPTFAMIETAEGFGNLDEIASTPGLTGLYVGPSDLSLGLGLDTFADLGDPRLLEALDAVADAAKRHEIVLTFAMIETAEGFGNLDEIASTPGLDGLYVGPSDLSLGLGLDTFADLGDPRLLEALDAVADAAKRHEIVAGVHAPSPEKSAAMAERGFRFVTPAVDTSLVADGASAALERTRTLLGTSEDDRR